MFLKFFVGCCFVVVVSSAHLEAMDRNGYQTFDAVSSDDDDRPGDAVGVAAPFQDIDLGLAPSYAFIAQQLGFIDHAPSFLKKLCRFCRRMDTPLSTASEITWVVTTLMWFKIDDMDGGEKAIEILLPTLLISSVVWLLTGANRLVASYLLEDIEGFLACLETFVDTWSLHEHTTPEALHPALTFFAEQYRRDHSFLRNNRALVVDFYNRVAAGYSAEVMG